jgi:hypothetical protein
MADLNSLIAQGVQFRAPPDPFAQYAQMQQLQQGEQANQLGQMQMQEYQRGMAETNAMRRLDPSSATYLQDITRINPEKGFAFAKMQREAKSAGTEGQIKDVKLIADKLALLPEAYRMADTPEAYLALHRSIHADPVVGPWLSSIGATPKKGLAALRTAMDTGKFDELRTGSMQSVNQILEGMKPLVVGPSSSVLSGGVFKQAPAAPPSVSTLAKLQAELAALPPNSPLIPQYKDAIRKETQFAPQAVTTVQLPPQEKAEQSARGTLLVKEYGGVSDAAKLAVKTIPSIDANLNILNKGFETGFGTETKAAGAKVLGALGVQNAENFATDAQVFQAKATEAVLQKQLEQKGPQTESDAQRIDQVGAQLGKTTAGNKFVLTTAKEQYKRDIEQRNFYDSWWKNNKTYDGAESAWYAGEGGKSLFDRPALKQYAGGADAAARIPGQGAAARIPGQAKPPRTVTRTGTSGGKKVIEYSDGSVEYAPG